MLEGSVRRWTFRKEESWSSSGLRGGFASGVIDKKDIQPPPQFGAKVDVSILTGIGKSGDKLVALLNIDRLLSESEMQEVSAVATA